MSNPGEVPSNSSDVSRRGVLGLAGGLLAAAGLGGLTSPRVVFADDLDASKRPSLGKTRVTRIAHMTDLHLQPERAGVEGVAACLAHVATQKPDFILTGGDLIMDGYDATFERTKLQWDLFNKTIKDHAPCRVEHCLGNHDIWGWNKPRSKTKGTEPGWGKKWALENLGLDREYRAFDVGTGPGSWRVFVLDSIRPEGDTGYIAYLDDAQTQWLTTELEAFAKQSDRYALVVSHVPILAGCVLTEPWDRKLNHRRISGALMHLDAGELHNAFRNARNVRVCLSGHIHQIDRLDMEGVSYICDGAVCGEWWKGPLGTTREGYGVVDLYTDGTFEHVYVPFGWVAKD
jgi:Icc protein